MLFNSLPFVIFFIIFFSLYWFVFNKNLKQQNLLLLTGSYIFYAWWDWRFLSLLILNSFINFILGIYIHKSQKESYKKILLYLGLIQGIGVLFVFKYFNFFITALVDMLSKFNLHFDIHILNLILPLGISFYTFRILSYLLDIDKGKIKPTTDWVVFFSYVSFFPSLISGPIDRARTFIPQMEKIRVFEYTQAVDGIRQILWGLFKKNLVADNCAMFTGQVFDNFNHIPASSLWISAFFYAFQIYADFSGYSDMAIGFSRLIGFNITKNFDYPFFSHNIVEYWRKWHISLTSWVTEYVYTPLTIAFRNYNKIGLIIAITINLIVIGLWHGANLTFIIFGLVHSCLFIPFILKGNINKKIKNTKEKQLFPSFKEFLQIVSTFIIVMLAMIIFRAPSIKEAFAYLIKLFSPSVFDFPIFVPKIVYKYYLETAFFIIILILMEWRGRRNDHALAKLEITWSKYTRWIFYISIIITIFYFSSGSEQQFIYAQF
jgi:D-alanyl-lipoteichoic acid acyltransferase DltB (MBOAT superfamily)